MTDWKIRVRAAAVHLCISLLVAGVAAGLVFGLWYPYPYREVSGGRELFLLVVAVDVVLGPLVTFVVFNRTKPRKELVSRFPERTADIEKAIAATGQPVERLVYLPLASRKSFWTVLLDARTGQVLGFAPLDSF